MDQASLISELEAIVNKGFEDFPFPYVKGNSIRIGKVVIRKSKHGYLVYNTEINKQTAHTFSKASAIAMANCIAKGRDSQITTTIMDIDKTIEKHYMDSLYFKNNYERTKDMFRKEVLSTRLDLAVSNTEQARALLDDYIYS